jgi:UDP-N-acetylmuramate--alanine ligase
LSLLEGKKRIHFIGVAGIGMSGLAKAVKALGHEVSGSDVQENWAVQELRERGVAVRVGHEACNAEGADLVVYSSAIREDNPEYRFAHATGIPVIHRAELLACFMNRGKGIGVLGTHGKTTTTSLVSHLLTRMGLRPTCFVGAKMINFHDNVLLGDQNWVVAEVDESDGTHRLFSPAYVVLTNIEEDHLDHYANLADIQASFREFLAKLAPASTVIYSADCPNLREVVRDFPGRLYAYGLSRDAVYTARDVRLTNLSASYELVAGGEVVQAVTLHVPGVHNVQNSLGAIALLSSMGFPYKEFLSYLPEFRGAGRRLEFKWAQGSRWVVDDYAHHPTEVRASLNALKPCGRQITCVFQPHRYSRVFSLSNSFGSSFGSADRVIVTDIYGAGETNTHEVDSGLIEKAVCKAGHGHVKRLAKEAVIDYLIDHPVDNEIVAFLGAGDITEVADRFVERLKTQGSSGRAG